jgi:D-3-phosphoglycerate dehydrogenase / 2-oxoglutarate reductase
LKILISDPISEDGLALLKQSKAEYQYSPEISPQDLLATITSFDALIVRSRTKVTKEVISKATNLKVIGRAGVGVDNIDSEAAKSRGLRVLNTPDALTNAVAEFTVGLMIDLSRKITRADFSMKQGKWEKSKIHGTELKGATYGTIGIGRIGQRVAEIAHVIGMKIMANDVIPIPDQLVSRLGIVVASQEEVFRRADFVDLHVPLTPETQDLVNYAKIKTMKPTSFLINTSRGKVVNELDLLRALDEKVIAGAALDVFEVEPPTQLELIKHENLIATPHVAGQTKESQTKAGTQIVELVLKALS